MILFIYVMGCIGSGKPDSSRHKLDTSRLDTSRLDTSSVDSSLQDSEPFPEDPAGQCARVCEGYAECGCGGRCQSWCDYYLGWDSCKVEIDALIACGARHPSPCSWGEEDAASVMCKDEISAFVVCSGNVFFPLPGVPEVCTD